ILLQEIKNIGMRILDNEMVDLRGIQLAGIDWKDSYNEKDCERILAALPVDRDRPSILMKHEPQDLPTSADRGFSLQLSGHTHAGQIFPLSLITHRVYHGFDYGLKKFGDMLVYTSSGVGTWGPPLRFGTKAEIVAITLRQ
ncbi:MAG TPA: metallophosphoesterase, partial [Candidatus Paceibacterota bacterium]|nr:metallophosphoesterase [Candidatus Paceibacterota bacterium]